MLAVSTLFLYPAQAQNEEAQADPQIYKSIDAQGRVRYSDKPSPNAQPVEVSPTTTQFAPIALPELPETEGDDTNSVLNQVSLSIIEPTAEEAVRANNGDVTFRWQVSAERLSSSLVFQLILDGNVVYQGALPQTTLTNLNRGEHQYRVQALLTERLTDNSAVEDAVVASTELQTFYLQRHSRLFPNGN